MTKNLLAAFVSFVVGIVLTESGILSVLVSLAYFSASGSAVPFLAGTVMVLLGSALVVFSTRIIRRKDDRKSRPYFES
ncbi:MAG: hypothetical protein LBT40_05445 [Deltaproteobacteria bacterium]|jgi:predicted branched-subunit amino acid permease|nr:hypothetical protein [Deltaproteobacteria bacterium]